MMVAERIATALNGKRSGNSWIAKCPAHDDKNPSLSIRDGNNGTVLVHCFSGCEQKKVLDALRSRGIWPDATREQRRAAERREHEAKHNHAELVTVIAGSDIAADREWNEEDRHVYGEAQAIIQSDQTEQRIEALAKLSPVEYERRRKDEAKTLDIRASVLDQEVARLRANKGNENGVGQRVTFGETEPWPEPVDGAALLDMILATLKRFIAFSNEHQAIATTLWVMLSHCYDAADTLPRLAPISPTKRCGKTTLLKLLRRMVRCPLITSNTTPAAIFRRIERDHPTLLIDELDSFADSHDELRGILNSGHDRESAYVDRTVSDNHEPKLFSTWAPMALAKIKDLPDTMQDRSIVIRLQRRKRSDKLTKTTGRNLNKHCSLNGEIPRRCARWAGDNMERLKGHEPTIPPGLIDRDEDNWFTMLAIAELVGGHWPKRTRAAAIELSETDELDQGIDGLLLADIRRVFNHKQTDQLKSSDLVEALRLLEGRPWKDWGRNRNNPGLTERDLSIRLKPYDIKPDRLYFDGNGEKGIRQRGYRLEWFERAFDTYIGDDQDGDEDSEPSPIPLSPGPPAGYPSQCPNTEKTSVKPLSVPVPESEVGTDENRSKPLENQAWDTGTDKKGDTGGRERKKCPTCNGYLYWRPRDGDDRHWRCRKCVPTGRMRIELWDAKTDERVSLGGDA